MAVKGKGKGAGEDAPQCSLVRLVDGRKEIPEVVERFEEAGDGGEVVCADEGRVSGG